MRLAGLDAMSSGGPISPTVAFKRGSLYGFSMPDTPAPTVAPNEVEETSTLTRDKLDSGYLVICWDDPVNLMDYVTHVFQKVFNWPREKARKHMLQVHQQGKSVLVRETLERAEHYVHQLQQYRLHATMEKERD